MNRRSLRLAIAAILSISTAGHKAIAAVDEVDRPAQEISGAREMFAAAGMEEDQWRSFADGLPLQADEQDALLRALFAIRKFARGDLERWSRAARFEEIASESPESRRGEIFRLQGTIERVTRIAVPEPLAARFDLPHYYRCELALAESRRRATVFSCRIPKDWPFDEPISERAGCLAAFAKLAAPVDERQAPMFVAARMEWRKRDALGDLGMDFALFDDVENRASMRSEESECFYQLLAACNRADADDLLRLAMAQDDASASVVPLFNAPDRQFGRLVALTGRARRAIRIRLDPRRDADAIGRFGFDHYYQIELFTPDSQGNPLVFCVLKLPEGMREGASLDERLRIAGFFFKTWAYHVLLPDGSPNPARQLAPMLIGCEPLRVVPETETDSLAGIAAGSLFLLAILGAFGWIWHWKRTDAEFHRAVLAKRLEPPAGALDELP